MRHPLNRKIITVLAAQALLAGAAAAAFAAAPPRAPAPSTYSGWDEMTVRDEIRRSFKLMPGADIRVAGIAGSVTIETASGSEAEVYVLRLGATPHDLDCTRLQVSGGADGISIEGVRRQQRDGCSDVRARQEVRLRLPRSVNLDISGIAGRVDAASVEGSVRASGIAGSVTVAGARSADISSVAGRVALTLGTGGAEIASVAGPVDIAFARGAGAQVHATSIIGRVSSLSPGVEVYRDDRGWSARVGSGGARVEVSSVVGPVRLSLR
jgi:hypothetical protein